MNWLDLIATVVGIAVAIFTLGKYVNDLYKAIKNGGDLKSWFNYGRKVKGLKYLTVFQKRSVLGSRTEISNSVRHQLTREIAKDVIHSYCIGRRVSRISRSSRDQLAIVFSVFGLLGIVVASAVLRKITNVAPAKLELINSIILMLGSVIGCKQFFV